MAHFHSLFSGFIFPLMALLALPQIAAAQDKSDTDFEEVITDAPKNQIRPYVGLAVEAIDLESFDSPTSVDFFPEATTTAVFRGGVVLHRYFAVEGEAALGISNQDGDGVANYDNRFAGYGRARYPFGDSGLEVFVRLGYATTSIESINVIGDSNPNGITYGGGVAFNFGDDDQFQLRGDFTQFEFGNDQNASGFAFGVGYNF